MSAFSWVIGGAAVAGIGAAVRSINVARAHRAAAHQRPRPHTAEGIIIGAEPLYLEGTGRGAILLFHGFNDTPQSVADFARVLNRRGWSVTVPLLPQHGRGADVLAREGSSQAWIAAASVLWQSVRTSAPCAVLAGQSMGGAIAVILAADQPPHGLVLLAPYVSMGRLARVLAYIWPLWTVFAPQLLSDPRRGIHDSRAREQSLSNGRFTPRLVRELARVVADARRALPAVRCPTLVFNARSDYRIPAAAAAAAFEQIGASNKELVWRSASGHVLAADSEHENIAAETAGWLDTLHPERV